MKILTRELWQALQQVDEGHPLYRYLRLIHYRRSIWASPGGYSNSMANMIITIILSPILILSPLAISPIFATIWAATVAGMIRYEYQQNRFDLMALLPGGGYQAYQTITTLHVRRSPLFHHLLDALNVTALVGGIFLFMLFSGLMVGLLSPDIRNLENILTILQFTTNATLIVGAFYADQIQSVILALQIGMLVPTFSRSTFEARAWAASAYIGAQLTLYSVSMLIGFWLLPLMLSRSTFQNTLSITTALGLLFLLRELTIRKLLRSLTTYLGHTP